MTMDGGGLPLQLKPSHSGSGSGSKTKVKPSSSRDTADKSRHKMPPLTQRQHSLGGITRQNSGDPLPFKPHANGPEVHYQHHIPPPPPLSQVHQQQHHKPQHSKPQRQSIGAAVNFKPKSQQPQSSHHVHATDLPKHHPHHPHHTHPGHHHDQKHPLDSGGGTGAAAGKKVVAHRGLIRGIPTHFIHRTGSPDHSDSEVPVANKPSDGHHRRVDLPNINSPESQPSISNFKAPHRTRKASDTPTTTMTALTKMHRQHSQDIHHPPPQTIHKPLQPTMRKPKPLPATLPSMGLGSKTNLAQEDPMFQKNTPSPLPSVKNQDGVGSESSESHPTSDGKLPSLTSVTTWKEDSHVADSRLGHISRIDDHESVRETREGDT